MHFMFRQQGGGGGAAHRHFCMVYNVQESPLTVQLSTGYLLKIFIPPWEYVSPPSLGHPPESDRPCPATSRQIDPSGAGSAILRRPRSTPTPAADTAAR